MAHFYFLADVLRLLEENGCDFEGDTANDDLLCFGRDSIPFVLPNPDRNGRIPVELVQQILADRWTGVTVSDLTLYPYP
jgi:hypothetical protein